MRKRGKGSRNYVCMIRQGKKNTQVWRAWVDRDEVVTQWGVLDGKMQETVDIPGPKGKPGTRAFITPEQAARDQVIRGTTIKAKRGYVLDNEVTGTIKEKLSEELEGVRRGDGIDFDGPLPQNVSFSKPVNSIPRERVEKNDRAEAKALGGPFYAWTEKMNGMCHVVSKDKKGKVWIQQRGKLRVENDKYPHLWEEFDALLPPESIVLCEFYLGEGKSSKDFTKMQSVANSLPERAKKLQKKEKVRAYVFRVPAWKGAMGEATTLTGIWLNFLTDLNEGWEDPAEPDGFQLGFMDLDYVTGVRQRMMTYEKAMQLCEDYGLEGWVIYQRDKSLGKKAVSFLGQPDRPAVCWKVKPIKEDDFVGIWDPDGEREHCSPKCRVPDAKSQQEQVRTGKCCVCGKKLQSNGSYGTGKNMKRVGSISLYQFGEDQVKRYVCEVGSGLTDKQKQQIADDGMFVEVLQIGYQDRKYITRGDDSNALTFPKVMRIRKSKKLRECKDKEI